MDEHEQKKQLELYTSKISVSQPKAKLFTFLYPDPTGWRKQDKAREGVIALDACFIWPPLFPSPYYSTNITRLW